ncbi:hypothetical protein CEQ31_026590 [Serratia odorifera]|nr:hypothetical protein CEQ31_026590 [Serratia odorifera]
MSGRPALSLGEAISGLPQRTWPEAAGDGQGAGAGVPVCEGRAHIDIGVMPRQEGRPVPGVVEQDIVGDQKLMLTAVPFAGRATFHTGVWMMRLSNGASRIS